MGFRTCMGILNAARDMDKTIVEAVAGKMLSSSNRIVLILAMVWFSSINHQIQWDNLSQI